MVINCKFVKYGIAVANCGNQVARSNGERAINSVANLVNEGKALIIAPRANSQLASKVDEYIQATNSNNYNLQGDIGEEIADILFREVNPSGSVANLKLNDSGHGLDVISIWPNDAKGMIIDCKPLNANSVVLKSTNFGPQMSSTWTNKKILDMMNHSDPIVKAYGNNLNNLYLSGKIEGYLLTVDKNLKQVIILKLDNF